VSQTTFNTSAGRSPEHPMQYHIIKTSQNLNDTSTLLQNSDP